MAEWMAGWMDEWWLHNRLTNGRVDERQKYALAVNENQEFDQKWLIRRRFHSMGGRLRLLIPLVDTLHPPSAMNLQFK